MKTKILLGSFFTICMLIFSILPVSGAGHSENPVDVTPSWTEKCKMFIVGSISQVSWEQIQSGNTMMTVHVLCVFGFSKMEKAVIGFPFVVLFQTLSFEYFRTFQGFYTDHWICGTISYSVRIGVP